MKSTNSRRRRAKHARNFGEEAERVREMPCLVASPECRDWVQAAHVVARGMGGSKGGRFDLVPLCARHHREAGERGTTDRASFETEHGLDLRAEADRIALEHERPLGIRGLADRLDLGLFEATDRLDLSLFEATALLGWVRRRMEREVAERAAQLATGILYEGEPHDLGPSDREALAHAVMIDLGGEFVEDTHGEHDLAWTLCELAGWPS